jgi:phage terminase large subunit-like protein
VDYYRQLQNDSNLWRIQYQQEPTLASGNKIKREWFEYVPALPKGCDWKYRAWDIAFTEKQTEKHDPDWTWTGLGMKHNDIMYVGSPRLFRKDIDGIATEIVLSKMSEPGIRYGMGRIAIKSSIVKAMNNAGFAIEEYEEHTDKIARASAWINWASQGRIKLVGTVEEWASTMAQWLSFPAGHDDAVDGMSGLSQLLDLTVNVPTPRSGQRTGPAMEAALKQIYG